MDNIYLVGFMGTGKTSAGKEVARRLKRRFVDLDDLIQIKETRSISDIFAKNGEPYFRNLEKEVLREVSKENKLLVACGGGIVIDQDNIKIMKDTGFIICLSCRVEMILKRTSGCADRPLLNVSEPAKQIESLLKIRAPYYALADKTIDTSDISVSKTADKILEAI